MEQKLFWHWFHTLKGITQKEKEELLNLCPKVEVWYRAEETGRTEELFGDKLQTDVQKKRKREIQRILEDKTGKEAARRSFDVFQRNNIKIVTREDTEFPLRLRHVYLSPFVLYYKGSLPKEDKPSIGIIGARNCSVYGEELAKEFGSRLSEAGIQIISGMARGIDAGAQRCAVDGGNAFAVLGSGVDVCYPKENKELYLALCNKGGVISEEPPGTAPAGYLFPKRNRIIAGLSDALLVVEAREKSGSLITVGYALEQGKEIYAVPGRLYDHLADGTNRLIQEGAYLVREPGDILQNFVVQNRNILTNSQKNQKLLLETDEKIVYACLSLHPKHMEQIAQETGIPVPSLSVLLFEMEMKHYIKQPMKNYYVIQTSI